MTKTNLTQLVKLDRRVRPLKRPFVGHGQTVKINATQMLKNTENMIERVKKCLEMLHVNQAYF